MIYQEKKTKDGYDYTIEDVFGKIEMKSAIQLDGPMLDSITMTLMRQNISAETITGTVKHKDGVLEYVFKKTDPWKGPDPIILNEEKIPCENTPTKTKRLEKWYTAILNVPRSIWNWCKRFAVAYREAGKSNK